MSEKNIHIIVMFPNLFPLFVDYCALFDKLNKSIYQASHEDSMMAAKSRPLSEGVNLIGNGQTFPIVETEANITRGGSARAPAPRRWSWPLRIWTEEDGKQHDGGQSCGRLESL